MTPDADTTYWLQRLKQGDSRATQELWHRYFIRVVALARQQLQMRGSLRRIADEEDVALSAFDSFCRRAPKGQFHCLDDRNDLWQLLAMLTVRKAANQACHEKRQKRGGGAVFESDFAEVISKEPDPALAAELTENVRYLLAVLKDDTLRAIARYKMDGLTNEEIATRLAIARVTVERKLALIRDRWENHLGE